MRKKSSALRLWWVSKRQNTECMCCMYEITWVIIIKKFGHFITGTQFHVKQHFRHFKGHERYAS